MATVKIRLRRDTAANWTAANPTLAEGEIARETDTGRIKYGDGATAWNALPYWKVPAADLPAPVVTVPVLQNGWSNYGDVWAPAKVRKSGGVVTVEGLVLGGANFTTVLTLPAGYRPPATLIFMTLRDGGPARIDVHPDGTVEVREGAGSWVSLTGVTFIPAA